MRMAVMVIGALAAAGGAVAQDPLTAAISSVATATAGAGVCQFELNRQESNSLLGKAGFSRDNPDHVERLETSFRLSSAQWAMFQAGSGFQQDILRTRCDPLWNAYGPDGLIRKGLLSRK